MRIYLAGVTERNSSRRDNVELTQTFFDRTVAPQVVQNTGRADPPAFSSDDVAPRDKGDVPSDTNVQTQ